MKRWILLVLVGCGSPDASGGSRDGAEIFARMCASCHGGDGRPSSTMVARLGVRDLTDPALRARLTPALAAEQVRRGSSNKLMPAFEGVLTPAQITALADYVAGPAFVAPR